MAIKICKKCGKEFEAHTNQTICQECKLKKCEICGQLFLPKQPNQRTCCWKCRDIWRKQTGSAKKGAIKAKQTYLEHYGVDNPSQVEEIKEKKKQTSREHYGKDYPMQSEKMQKKFKQTLFDRYGVTNISQIVGNDDKVRATNRQKYGADYYTQTDAWRQKTEATGMKKYGKKYYMQTDEYKERYRQTCLKRYNVENWHTSQITDPSKIEMYEEFKKDPEEFIRNNFREKPTRKQLAIATGVDVTVIDDYIKQQGLQNLIKYHQGSMEMDIKEFLIELRLDTQILMHDRKVIAPQELDFYLPEYKLAIECNPTYTHNSSKSIYGTEGRQKPINYHREKSLKCSEKGIFLFHIYGYEWTVRQEIIKSMIRNLLGKNENRVYARNCYICDISQNDADEFLEINHRQGETAAKYRIGLRENGSGRLVSIMCFKGLRNTLAGAKDLQGKNIIELTRFCSLLNTTVVGGASKMFKSFVKDYGSGIDKIVSYSDVSHMMGGVYEKLGFTKTKESVPTYRWVNLETDEALNREACRKGRLRKLFNDEDIDIENKTENEIMQEHGYVKVYDSGLTRWEYTCMKI